MKQTTMYLSQDDLDYVDGIALEKCISRVAALSLIIDKHRDSAVPEPPMFYDQVLNDDPDMY